MTNANANNRPHTAAAWLSEPAPQRQYNTEDERTFLAQQAADAQTAMQRTLADMQASAVEVANVRWWTQHYPWYAVGTAAVLGYVITTAVLAPSAPQPQPAPPTARQATARASWTAALFAMARETLLGIIREALHPNGPSTRQAPVDPSVS
jgi:hypothetical protein